MTLKAFVSSVLFCNGVPIEIVSERLGPLVMKIIQDSYGKVEYKKTSLDR